MTAGPEDHVSLRGATNFRSLGGLPTASGRRIRPHALMRADRLSGLADEDWRALAQTGLATVCDLRSEGERAEHPNAVPVALGVREIRFDVRNDLRADASLLTLLAADPTARGTERIMIEIYRRFPEHLGGTLSRIVDELLGGGAPLLVHCSAGKDRTGFVVAMLLHALEVPESAIRVDYLRSSQWPGAEEHRGFLERQLGVIVRPAELRAAVDAVLGVREAYLDAALDALAQQHGTVGRYLEQAAGLDSGRLEQLRERLLA